MPITRVLADSLTHVNVKCENQSLVFHSLDNPPIFILVYLIPCVYLGREFLGSHCRLRMSSDTFVNFHRWIHMSDQE